MTQSIGLLLLRIGVGGLMAILHGWDKLISFSFKMNTFPDPFHLGSPISLALTVFSELFCSILLIFGLATRVATIPLIITMLVAIFVIHGEDPVEKKELALLYLIPYITLFFTGAGKISLDHIVLGKKEKTR